MRAVWVACCCAGLVADLPAVSYVSCVLLRGLVAGKPAADTKGLKGVRGTHAA